MGEKMFHNIRYFLKFAGGVVRQKVMATLARGGGNRGGKLSRSGLARWGILMYFCSTRMDGWARGAHLLCNPLINYLSMHYYSYDYPSAITEERLAGIVCASVNESVKDYLSETTEYVKRCQRTMAEQQEIIDELEAKNLTLQQQVDELKQCLKACTAASSKQVNFNKVGTVVAHADHVTLQYKAS